VRWLFWILCGLIAYAYVGYPLLLMLLAAIFGRRPRRDPSYRPAVSILIPAYNEASVIAAKLDNALALEYPESLREVIVASESDDGTNAIVERYAQRGVRLVASSERRGKPANLARAVPHATGEILVFTDANAMFRPDAIARLVRSFADPRVGSVSGRLVYRRPGGETSAAGEETYWGLEMIVKRASSDLGSLPGANGSLFALRRSLYRPISETRGDDFELPIRVILDGHDSVLDAEAVSEEPSASRYRDEYRRKVRIINWMSISAMILLREAVSRGRWLLAFQLLSHKLNRWAVPFWLLALAPVSVALVPGGGIYAAVAFLQAAIYTLVLLGAAARWAELPLPRWALLPLYFAVVNSAAFVGLITGLAGRQVRWHKRRD